MAELQLDEKLGPEWLWQRFLFSISITHSSIHPPTEPSIHPSLHLSFIVTASASPPPSLPSVSSGAQWPLPFHLHLLPPSRWGTPRLAVPRECSASLWTRAIGTTSWASSPGGWAGSSPWWCPFPRRAPACPCRRHCTLQSERGGQAGVGKPQRRLRVPAPPGWGSRCAHNPVLTNSNGHTHTHTLVHTVRLCVSCWTSWDQFFVLFFWDGTSSAVFPSPCLPLYPTVCHSRQTTNTACCYTFQRRCESHFLWCTKVCVFASSSMEDWLIPHLGVFHFKLAQRSSRSRFTEQRSLSGQLSWAGFQRSRLLNISRRQWWKNVSFS